MPKRQQKYTPGSALVKAKKKNRYKNRKNPSDRHVVDEDPTKDQIDLDSMLDPSSINNFMKHAQISQDGFETLNPRKLGSTHLEIFETKRQIEAMEFTSDNDLQKQAQYQSQLTIPERPLWTYKMTSDELELLERTSFLDWRRSMAMIEERAKLILTPFETNPQVWKQLWRVVERSHVVVQIVDARNPLLFRSTALEKYVFSLESSHHIKRNPQVGIFRKRNLLLINKADYLPLEVRRMWVDYFNRENVKFVFFSAIAPSPIDDQLDQDIENSQESSNIVNLSTVTSISKPQLVSISQSASKADQDFFIALNNSTKIYTASELVSLFQLLDTRGDFVQHDSLKKWTIGFVGYPNVGKSSTLNCLIGEKKTSVGATPGKTKYLQTIELSDTMTLCDCPGLVFPTIVSSKADLIINGILPIDRIRDPLIPMSILTHRIPRAILELTYGIKIPEPAELLDEDADHVIQMFNAYQEHHLVSQEPADLSEFLDEIDPNGDHIEDFQNETQKEEQKTEENNLDQNVVTNSQASASSEQPVLSSETTQLIIPQLSSKYPANPYEFLSQLAASRGFFNKSHGGPNISHAARIALKDYFSGKLLYVIFPPKMTTERGFAPIPLEIKLETNTKNWQPPCFVLNPLSVIRVVSSENASSTHSFHQNLKTFTTSTTRARKKKNRKAAIKQARFNKKLKHKTKMMMKNNIGVG